MSELLRAALDYASRGWPIFPLIPGTKEPFEGSAGVLDATTDAKQIRAWWTEHPQANIGLDVGGAGMMALDLDPGHDPAALDAAVGGRPGTPLRQRTPRGGTHEFYALARGETVPPSASKVAPSVDVRSFHSYVLLAPSYVDDGKAKGTYTWENEDWPAPKPAFRTERMIQACQQVREKDKDRDTWIIEANLPENVDRYTRWLKGELAIKGKYSSIAVLGKGGDHCALATAAMGKSFGISADLTFDLMLEHWNPRCDPPWSGDELSHLQGKVENAYRYNTSPPGNMTDAYRKAKSEAMFQPVLRDATEGAFWSSGRFRIVDRDAMEDIRDPSWLVPDLIVDRSYSMLVGAPGSLKTYLALDIGLALANGIDTLWPGTAGNCGPVVFAAGEGRSGLRDRARAWEKTYLAGKRTVGSNWWLVDPVPAIAREGEVETFIQLVSHALDGGKPKLVIIDTVGRAMQGISENDQEHASKFTAAIELITKELDCAVLAIHHSGHGEKRARGSSVFQGDVDMTLFAERDGKEKALTLTMQKQKDAPEWEKPKLVTLEEVQLGEKRNLVVSRNTGAGQPLPAATPQKPVSAPQGGRRGRPLGVAPELVDTAAMAVLSKLKGWSGSSNQLADMIASHMGSGVPASTIRTNYMRNFLQCDAKFKSYARYDALTKRWKSAG